MSYATANLETGALARAWGAARAAVNVARCYLTAAEPPGRISTRRCQDDTGLTLGAADHEHAPTADVITSGQDPR